MSRALWLIGVVVLLPLLRELYLGKLTADWKAKVAEATKNRVTESQSPEYSPHGSDKALGPWGPPQMMW